MNAIYTPYHVMIIEKAIVNFKQELNRAIENKDFQAIRLTNTDIAELHKIQAQIQRTIIIEEHNRIASYNEMKRMLRSDFNNEFQSYIED